MGEICIVLKACITNIGQNLEVSAIYSGSCLRNYAIGETGISGLICGSNHDGTPLIISISPQSWDISIPKECLNHRYY